MGEKRSYFENDETIIRFFRDGDLEAFHYIFQRTVRHLMNFVMDFIDDEGQSENIVASVFSDLYNSRRQIDSFRSLENWVFSKIRNVITNYYEGEAVQNGLNTSMALIDFNKIDTSQRKNIFLLHVSEAIRSLPLPLSSVVNLAYIRKTPDSDICKILGINDRCLAKRKKNAINALRKAGFILLEGKLVRGFFAGSEIFEITHIPAGYSLAG
jgi:RNA polymerase sigma factor (sigma-70 family)